MLLRFRRIYGGLEKDLGYKFKKQDRLTAALTHRSFRYEGEDSGVDNQRLEFLGDAVLSAVCAAHLFQHFEEYMEGEMTNHRSRITSGKTLGDLARSIDLGRHIKVGRGEEESGGRERSSNLADALEAVIGAAYLDGGIGAVEKIFRKLFVPVLHEPVDEIATDNPKGRLQEYVQIKWKKNPLYRVKEASGPPHARTFVVEVVLPDGSHGVGRGSNKRIAETEAATQVLSSVWKDVKRMF
jgi:ribonuclease III